MNDYERIARVIEFLDENHVEQPDLGQLAEHIGLSPFHFHRLFSRWAGVTPKVFLQSLTLKHAKESLLRGHSVLDAALEAGLSGPSRLHDLCVNLEAASPGEVKSAGKGLKIRAGFAETPFGTCLIGETSRGICHLSFVPSADQQTAVESLKYDWANADIEWSESVAAIAKSIFATNGTSLTPTTPLRAFVRGSEFQVKVWRALLEIPAGSLSSYGRLAESIVSRSSARAVGTAVGKNSIAFLIPCHRVIRETGMFGDYRWGATRKRAMAAWESALKNSGVLQRH